MRYFITVGFFFLGLTALFGQTSETDVIPLKQQASEVVMKNPEPGTEELEQNHKGYWNFSVGTSFSHMKSYGSGMSFFIAPSYTLPLTGRWSVHGGVVASQYQGFNGTTSMENLMPNSLSSFALFVATSYRMNDRLVLHGAGVKQLASGPATPFAPYAMDHVSLGATYKLTNNITIGASVRLNQGYGNYGTPLNGHMFPTPFGW